MDLGLSPKPSRESLVMICWKEQPTSSFMLWEKVETLAKKMREQDANIGRLEAKHSKNSSTSSKPSSTDKSNSCEKLPAKNTPMDSVRKSSGQSGHNGATLEKSDSPDHIVLQPKQERCTCGEKLPSAYP